MTDVAIPTAPTAPPAPSTPLQSLVKQIESNMNSALFERQKEIRSALLALLSNSHMFLLGSPGIAKTALTKGIVRSIDFSDTVGTPYTEILLTAFSGMEDAFGPVSVKGLEEDRYYRKVEGFLPSAYIAFLDELFKANPSILNALLTWLNERIFRNDGQTVEAPLMSMFCASNEMPKGEELEALYDRIHIRHVVRPLQEPGNFIKMLESDASSLPTVMTLAQLQQACDEVRLVTVAPDVLEALTKLRSTLRADGIEPTDRRFKESLRIVRANAWLEGREIAEIDDIKVLRHVLWTTVAEIPFVDKHVLELSNPLDSEAIALLDQVHTLVSEIEACVNDSDNDEARRKTGMALFGKLQRAKQDFEELQKKQRVTGRKSEAIDELERRLDFGADQLLTNVFRMSNPDQP